MSAPQKKGRSPKSPRAKTILDQSALAKLTSRIDRSLISKEQKRKQAPTNVENKEPHHRKRQRNLESGRRSKISSKDSKEDNTALLAEIKALGGDEKDLELIEGFDSDDQSYAIESSKPIEKGFKDELLAFSQQLGFENVDREDVSDSQPDETQDFGGASNENESDWDESEDEVEENRVIKPGGMIFEPRADWHAYRLAPLPMPTTEDSARFTGAVEALKLHANTILEHDANRYKTSVFASSSHKFLSTIMSSGTLTDKVSALTLAIQESPLHNMRAFDALINLASKKSRAQAVGAIGALVDLLGPGAVLPPDRRLRSFQSQPGLLGTLQRNSVKSWSAHQSLPGKITEVHLISWAYEDWLKKAYFKIIQLLETWCSDEIEHSRMKAVDFVYGLLKEKPEQEANLLTLLVHKLGDRDRKIASRASYLLLQLQISHPGMKPIIIRSIEQDVLLHPSQDHRSQYYAINTLNQTILSSKEPAITESLIRIYFDLFVALLKSGRLGNHSEQSSVEGNKSSALPRGREGNKSSKKESLESRSAAKLKASTVPETEAADKLTSALLTGVNRAVPFLATNDLVMEKHLDTLFRIAHSSNLNTGIQALMLIQHVSAARNMASDRFFRILYESLLDPRLINSSKQALYLNLLMRSLKSDVDVRRVKAFSKRMLQVSNLHQPPFVCGSLYIIANLRETFPDLPTMIEQPEESIFDDEASAARPAYDGRKRDPEYSNAQRACLWELATLQAHFHPSVRVTATNLLDKTTKIQKPDMESHTMIRFLDKFVYRQPKSADSARGASIMQPLRASKDLGDLWLGSKGAGAMSKPVNSSAFWKQKVEDVAVDDVFFHEYFQHAAKEPKAAVDKKSDAGIEDNEEDEVWKALVSTQPDIEDEGSEEGFDDLDELDMASEDGSSPAMSLESDIDDDDDGDDDEVDEETTEAFVRDDEDVDSEGSLAVGETGGGVGKQDRNGMRKQKSRRQALKDLPMFASVDDYADLLAGEEDGL